jgi:sugar (pentulose or hexulose) kinase
MLMTSLLMGLDVGTTSSKAVIYTVEGNAVASGRSDTPWVRTSAGTEISPAALLSSVLKAMSAALRSAPAGHFEGLGITSMGESGVLLESHGDPIGNVIAWHDTRDSRELDELAAWIKPSEFAAKTGLPLSTQWSITKLKWSLRNSDDSSAIVQRLNIAEWIAYTLGAAPVAEQSLASRTGFFDLRARCWWSEAVEWSGAVRVTMPEIVTAGTALGRVSHYPGLERLSRAVITVAGHDHQTAVVGFGAVDEGDAVDSCGSAEAMVRTTGPNLDSAAIESLTTSGVTVGWSPLANRWTLLGGTRGGLALQSVLSILGLSADELSIRELDSSASNAPLPIVTAIDPERITINGVNNLTRPEHVWRAAVDNVTQQLADVDAAMSAPVGPRVNLYVTGGWANNSTVRAAKKRYLGDFCEILEHEAGTLGAAFFAGQAAGVYASATDFPRYRGRSGGLLLPRTVEGILNKDAESSAK